MKCKGLIGAGMTLLACLGLLVPGPALQASTVNPGPQHVADSRAPAVHDVALSDGGSFDGQVVDVQGNPQGRAVVSIRQLDREIATTISDASGYFRFTGLRGGIYRIVAGDTVGVCRLWVPNTAPPCARRGALIVLGDQLALGQCSPCGDYGCDPQCGPTKICCPPRRKRGRLKRWLANPLVIGGIVAAAVAIPVAIHNAGPSSP